MKKKDSAVIIHRINFSNSSLIVQCFTRENGLQSFLYQGGKKKSALVFSLSLCEISFYHRADSQLGKLTDVAPLQPLHNIQLDPIKSSIAFFWADIIRKSFTEGQKDVAFFSFVENQISLLNDATNVHDFNLNFLLRSTEFLGIEPQKASVKKYLNIEEGIFTDNPIGLQTIDGDEIIAIQKMLLSLPYQTLSAELRRKILDVLVKYYQYHIPTFKIDKSLEIIRETLYQ